ncbi:eukaryotic cytochrome b561-domain-containing protein [Dissophora ornata]|nr:eukaryotic cytochrome b561-domain-containing protein [Dissophora ornata]
MDPSKNTQSVDESRPLFVSSPSAGQTEHHPRAHAQGYCTLDKLPSPLKQNSENKITINHHKNNNNNSNNISDVEDNINSPVADSASSSSSASSISSRNDGEDLEPQISSSLSSRRQSHRRASRTRMLLSVVTQLGLLVFFGTLTGVIAKAPWAYPYSWHPICMGLYGFIATEGILILQPPNKSSQRKTSKTLHGLLHTLALILSLLGYTAIYVNKERLQKEHLRSNHGLFGCTTVLIFSLQVVFGVAVAYGPRSLFRWIGHSRIIRIHRISGYISIGLLWLTLWLSVLSNWMKRNFEHEWVFALGLGMIAVGLVGQITPARLFGAHTRTHDVRP